jgi:hypothetical protein
MNKLEKYTAILSHLVEEYAAPQSANDEFEKQVLVDTEHLHFQVQSLGWLGDKFMHSVMLHFDIKPNTKIWIQQNWTEDDVAAILLQRGVAREDIVIGFQPPRYRELSGYAVA